jgi:hypothetical protein
LFLNLLVQLLLFLHILLHGLFLCGLLALGLELVDELGLLHNFLVQESDLQIGNVLLWCFGSVGRVVHLGSTSCAVSCLVSGCLLWTPYRQWLGWVHNCSSLLLNNGNCWSWCKCFSHLSLCCSLLLLQGSDAFMLISVSNQLFQVELELRFRVSRSSGGSLML